MIRFFSATAEIRAEISTTPRPGTGTPDSRLYPIPPRTHLGQAAVHLSHSLQRSLPTPPPRSHRASSLCPSPPTVRLVHGLTELARLARQPVCIFRPGYRDGRSARGMSTMRITHGLIRMAKLGWRVVGGPVQLSVPSPPPSSCQLTGPAIATHRPPPVEQAQTSLVQGGRPYQLGLSVPRSGSCYLLNKQSAHLSKHQQSPAHSLCVPIHFAAQPLCMGLGDGPSSLENYMTMQLDSASIPQYPTLSLLHAWSKPI
ncbi:unnamed protein product [Protopolystoma xenopodis]|uniref:Uncharacterized protein n=1 Tax=Protopolystoma xenopodis TaxID=117903 RepID=A0A3S4ZM88_9PLAT|nr:unnamed protein product [Protopolystoma xenopodis]